MQQAQLYTFEVFCPTQRTNVSIPMYDCVRINWEARTIQFYCLACKDNHTVGNLRSA